MLESLALALAAVTAPVTPSPARIVPPPAASVGRVDSFAVAAAPFADSLMIRVYLPAGYDAARAYPLVYTFMRQVYFDRIGLPAVLDSAIAAGLPPVIAVGIPAVEDARSQELGTREQAQFRRLLAERVIPAVERRYRVAGGVAGRRLLGFSSGANVLLDLALAGPVRFGRVAAQSPGWMFRDSTGGIGTVFFDTALRQAERARRGGTAFWFMWGDGAEEWESRSRAYGARYVAALRTRGVTVAEPVIVPGDHGLALIRASLAPALAFLTAPEAVAAR